MKHIVPILLAYLNIPKKVEYIEMKHSNSVLLPKTFPTTILSKVYHVYGSHQNGFGTFSQPFSWMPSQCNQAVYSDKIRYLTLESRRVAQNLDISFLVSNTVRFFC